MTRFLILAAALCSSNLFASGAAAPGSEALWTGSLASVRAAVKARAPEIRQVRMTVDHWSRSTSEVSEPNFGVNLQLDRPFGGDMDVRGSFNAHVFVNDRRSTFRGVDVMGDGVNVSLRPFGGTSFILSGIYRKDGTPGDANLNLRLDAYPNRDFALHARGADLDFSWNGSGYWVEGTVDAKVFGTRELTVLGAAFAALTRDGFR